MLLCKWRTSKSKLPTLVVVVSLHLIRFEPSCGSDSERACKEIGFISCACSLRGLELGVWYPLSLFSAGSTCENPLVRLLGPAFHSSGVPVVNFARFVWLSAALLAAYNSRAASASALTSSILLHPGKSAASNLAEALCFDSRLVDPVPMLSSLCAIVNSSFSFSCFFSDFGGDSSCCSSTPSLSCGRCGDRVDCDAKLSFRLRLWDDSPFTQGYGLASFVCK
mmetsp:Transcript_12889/g.27789  ORF Transcript_12889/g.27789 Transcript_12889/m.27789 type:complete len:223 (+) Transcript_12889:1059-1727(+)